MKRINCGKQSWSVINVNRRRLLRLAGLLLIWSMLAPVVPVDAFTAGGRCSKAGVTQTRKGLSYICVKTAGKTVWKVEPSSAKGKTNSTTTPFASTTTTIPSLSADAVTSSTQRLVEAVDLSASRSTTSVVMHVEPGSNGEWPTFMEDALKYSLNFYSAIGFTFTQPRVDFVLGRTQLWSKSKIGELFPGCWPDDKIFSGGYSLCAYPNRGGIGINLVNSVLPRIGLSTPEANIAGVKWELYWNSVAHEAWHNWQDGIGYTNAVSGDPTWWKEGGAVYFSTIAWAKFLNKGRFLDTLWFWDVDPNGYQSLSQSACTMRISNLNNDCSYSKGALIVQYFVYRFGVEKYLSVYSTWQRNLTFSMNFQRVTGMALDQFYAQSEDWLASRGWRSM